MFETFWANNEFSLKDNCFSKNAKQVALGISMSNECIFSELGIKGDPWLLSDLDFYSKYCKLYNDKAEKIVGKRLLNETYINNSDLNFPSTKGIADIFEGKYKISGGSSWLHSDIETPSELSNMLDRADKRIENLREFYLPQNWYSEKKRIYEKYGKTPEIFRGIRGPVTLAMSIYGVENLIYLINEDPALAKRFSNSITNALLAAGELMDTEAGYTKNNAPHGFGFSDDNCCMLNAEMYEFFAYPILKAVFERYSPNKNDRRHQHSDSAMGHLLPILGKLDLTSVNFGPTVMFTEIRKYLPNACIRGCIAPFTFMRNETDNLIAQVKRDCEAEKNSGRRGLCLTTAGSINDGSLLTSLKTIIESVIEYGTY